MQEASQPRHAVSSRIVNRPLTQRKRAFIHRRRHPYKRLDKKQEANHNCWRRLNAGTRGGEKGHMKDACQSDMQLESACINHQNATDALLDRGQKIHNSLASPTCQPKDTSLYMQALTSIPRGSLPPCTVVHSIDHSIGHLETKSNDGWRGASTVSIPPQAHTRAAIPCTPPIPFRRKQDMQSAATQPSTQRKRAFIGSQREGEPVTLLATALCRDKRRRKRSHERHRNTTARQSSEVQVEVSAQTTRFLQTHC
mmetsp:Transcript_10123/g.24535  ORF Transcript_10123/g.24535 Transcript_10123/m.24535 type:complete len:254 (-) Transcript_10123:1258-2019(-)